MKNCTKKQIKKKPLDYRSIGDSIGRRWESGIPHHPRAEKIARLIGEIDFNSCEDSLALSFGGDGDNGENLTYILDEIITRKLI